MDVTFVNNNVKRLHNVYLQEYYEIRMNQTLIKKSQKLHKIQYDILKFLEGDSTIPQSTQEIISRFL